MRTTRTDGGDPIRNLLFSVFPEDTDPTAESYDIDPWVEYNELIRNADIQDLGDMMRSGIMRVESADGELMMNPKSSATGLYGQLYNEIKDMPFMRGISREQFRDDRDLQNRVLQMRMEGEVPGIPGLYRNARELEAEYRPQFEAQGMQFRFRPDEILALTNYLGRQGTRNYFASLRDGTTYTPPGEVNKSPQDYLDSYNEGVLDYMDRQKAEQEEGDFPENFLKAAGGRVIKYEHGGKHDDDPPENFGVADNLLQVLGTYGKTRQEAEQDPNYEDRLDLTKEEVFDNFMDRYGPHLTSELNDKDSFFYNPDRPRRGGRPDLQEQMDKVRVIKEDPESNTSYFNTATDEVFLHPEQARDSVDRGSLEGEEFTHAIQDPFRESRGKYGQDPRTFDASLEGLTDASKESGLIDMATGKVFDVLPTSGVLTYGLGLNDDSDMDALMSLYYGGNPYNNMSMRNAPHELEAMMNTGLLQGIKTGVIPEGKITEDDFEGIVDRYNQGVARRDNPEVRNTAIQQSAVFTRNLPKEKQKYWEYDESGNPSMTKKGKKYYEDNPYQLQRDIGIDDYVPQEYFQTNPRHVRNLASLINKEVSGNDPMSREQKRNLLNYLNQEGYIKNRWGRTKRSGYAPRGGRDNPYLND